MANELYKIYSSFDPVAHSGDTLQIHVTQTLQKGSVDYLKTTGPDLKVAVQGPQTQLTETDISGVYPAAGSDDSPDNFLPHIALARRTLPWERIGPGPKTPVPNTPTVPWLALLVLTQDDLTLPGTFPSVQTGAIEAIAIKNPNPPVFLPPTLLPFGLVSMQVKALAASDPKTHAALIATAGITDNTTINTIQIPNATLKNILPAAGDLALLCNAKEVDQDGVTTTTSIVVSGRLPYAGAPNSATPPALHMAVLVSLEQRADVYTRFNDAGANTLVALHSWMFTPSKGGDFEEVCQMIGYPPNGGVMRFGNLPSILTDPTQAPLSAGYDALLQPTGFFQTPLQSDDTGNVIWRSSLRPFPPPPRSSGFAIRADPEELENQPAGAPLDYSHATAFELGRLLAVADDGVRQDLREVHDFLQLPTGFVVMSDLPQVFQKPYWQVDQGDASDTVTNQLSENPWSSSFGENQSLLGEQNNLSPGDVSGIAAQSAAWQASVVAQFSQAEAPSAGSVSQVDIGQVSEAALAVQFPEVVNAALISARE